MIAPLETAPELQLFLYLGPLEMEIFEIDPGIVPVDTSLTIPREEWWGVWCCEVVVTDPDREDVVALFMNVDTGISYLCPGHPNNFDELVQNFEYTFLEHLHQHGVQLPATVDFKLTLMQGTEDDAVVAQGFLEQLSDVAKAAFEARRDATEIQALLHETRLQPFEEMTPAEAFRRAVERHPPADRTSEPGPDEDVPF